MREDHTTRARSHAAVPPGYYDRVMTAGPPVQRAWHRQKFERVREMLSPSPGVDLLDIGCGPGSFLGVCPPSGGGIGVGIDVVAGQVAYARGRYGDASRHFVAVDAVPRWPFRDAAFGAAVVIEVIEHLTRREIAALFAECARVLAPGAPLVVTTPNYLSHWPVLECLVSRLGEVEYDEQHVTRFHRPLLRRQLRPLIGGFFDLEYATTIHFVAPFLAMLSRRGSDVVAKALTPRRWFWPFGALIIARLRRCP